MIPNSLRYGVAAVLTSAITIGAAQDPVTAPERLQITAFAVNMSNIGSGGAIVVDIKIDRWSTPAERQQLITTMIERGPRALYDALQDTDSCGRFSIPGLTGPDPHELRLGHTLHYAWQVPQPDGGRRIVIVSDRYIGPEEARQQPRSIDYPFTLFEIRVDKNGQGEGKMAIATRIAFDKSNNTMELENYSSEPVRLQSVKVTPVR